MSDDGRQVAERRKRIGYSVARLADAANVDRGTLTKYESGARGTRDFLVGRIHDALDRLEYEHGLDEEAEPPQATASSAEGLIEFDVSGDFGVHVVVKGPVNDAEALERSVVRLIRDMRERPDEQNGDTPSQP